MLLQLNPKMRLVTPLGRGWALFFEDDGEEMWWTVALDNGAIVQFPNNKIRAVRCYTLGRGLTDAAMRKIISKSA